MFTGFYELQSVETDQVGVHCCHVRINANHQIFGAHFPGNPIVPGVCIVQIAKELLNKIEGKNLTIKTIKNIKFLKIISPKNVVDVTFRISVAQSQEYDGCWDEKVVVSSDSTVFTKLSLILR